MRSTALICLAGLLGIGCLPQAPAYDPAASQQQYQAAMAASHDAVDAQMVSAVADARSKAEAGFGARDEALRWAGALEAAYQTGTVARGKINGSAETRAASEALDAAVSASPRDKPELLAARGRLELLAGDRPAGVKTLHDSIKARPNLSALLPLIAALDQDGEHAQVVPLCKKTRPNVAGDDERYILLEKCLEHSRAASIDQGLAWAGAADIDFYRREQDEARARAEQREQERRARAEQMMAESRAWEQERQPARGGGGAAGGGGMTPTSVEVRSECSRTVPVFYGEDPKFGSGTRSSVSSNSISSAPRRGDGTLTMWIVDDRDNGIASTSVSPSTRRITIDRSCMSLRAE